MEPYTKYTRSKWDTTRGGLGFFLRQTFCQLVLASCRCTCVNLSPLSFLLCSGSRWAPGPRLGLSRVSPGPLLRAILTVLGALGAPGCLMGLAWVTPGLSWIALGTIMGGAKPPGIGSCCVAAASSDECRVIAHAIRHHGTAAQYLAFVGVDESQHMQSL